MGHRGRDRARELREREGLPTYYEQAAPFKAAEVRWEREREARAQRADQLRRVEDTLVWVMGQAARRRDPSPRPRP
jgi:hypothetical protein